MNKKISLSLITMLALTSTSAFALKPVGYKAMGMGGTGVASTRGSLSGYYNPALLRFSDYTSEFSLNLGINVRESNLVDHVDKLNEVDFDDTLKNIAGNVLSPANNTSGPVNYAENIKTAKDVLHKIGGNNGLMVSATPVVSAQISDAFALGVYGNADVSLRLNVDTDRLDFIVEDEFNPGNYYSYNPDTNTYGVVSGATYNANSIEYAIDNGLTHIDVNARVLTEVPLSYAYAMNSSNGTYSLGLNIKPMGLVTMTKREKLGESSDNAVGDDSSFETTYKPTFGLDLGWAFMPKNSGMTFGLVGKNINTPTFKVDNSNTGITEDYEIEPSFAAGMSMRVFDNTAEFAIDADLTKNDTLIDDEKSQIIGAGLELHPTSWFALRVGAMKDIESQKFDDGVIITGGVGFGLKWAQIDLSAMVSSETGEYDGQAIPRYTAFNLALVSRWGDGYNKKKPKVGETVYEEAKSSGLSFEDKVRIKQDAEAAQKDLNKELE